MKLTFRQIEPFVENPDPAARLILVYGPDAGLVTERSIKISKSICADLNDPFNVANFTPEKILDDPAGFYDEANAQSLMGGQRLIIIKQGEDKISMILKEYLANASDQTLVVVEAGNLGTTSSLRKLCETVKNAAAVPCYVDDERNLAQIIREACANEGYKIDQNALISLSSALIGDRSIARNEIEKLLLYKGLGNSPETKTNRGSITMDDIIATYGDVKDWGLDRLVYAVADGNIQDTQSIIDSMIKDNTPPIVLLRSVQNHFWRLFSVQAKIADGLNQEEAIKTLSPPLFWKVTDNFKRQLRRWPLASIENILDSLTKIEAMTKKSDYDPLSIMTSGLVQIARFNPQARHAG